jgi:hypothetical protein
VIIVRLVGGLGNQMFQYAAGRRLSILHNTDLKLDTNQFQYYEGRSYSLQPFRIQGHLATPNEIAAVRGRDKRRWSRLAFEASQVLKPYYRRSVFREKSLYQYDSKILKTQPDVYLEGYFQAQQYFAAIEDVIRSEFTIEVAQDAQSRDLAEQIAATRSVSVHVRRGDYVSVPHIQRIHNVCGLSYYRKCIGLMATQLADPHFFVFSDDPDWVRANLDAGHLRLDFSATVVSHNGRKRAYEDLRLMSACKHNIIANSSFSWWGAWLNPDPNKIVMAPARWVKPSPDDSRPPTSGCQIVPDSWTQIAVD